MDTRSDNADLSALTLSSGTLDPTFSSGTTTYTASVTNATTSLTVTPTRAQANATIEARINGGSFAPVTSGSPSGSLALNIGANPIDVRVTAQNTTTTKTYTVTVTRAATAPTLTTATQSGVTHNSATLGGNVTADGGATVTERGIVWGTSANPTTSNNKVQIGSGTGVFSQLVSGLPSNTTVFVRAYAINSVDTAYGSEISFATPPAPTTLTSLNRVNPATTNLSTVNWTLTFAAANTGISASNFSLSGTATSGASVGTPTTANGGLTWNVPVTTGSTAGTLTLNLANAIGTMPGVSTSLPFAGQSYTMDKTAPTIGIGAPSVSSIAAGAGAVTYTVTYADTNFSASTLANGNITLNTTGTANGTVGVSGSGTTRTVTISSITGAGTLGISIAAGTASDTAGNTAPAAGPSTTFAVTSTNADLSALTLGSGTLSPAFASATTTYTASVTNATTALTVTPTRAEANATIEARVNGGSYTAVTSGSASGALSLNIGANTIDLRVTAQAGNTKTYTITVTRDKASQAITGFANPGNRAANTTVNLSATGGGSGIPVDFTVEGPASINGSNVLSFTGTGSVTVRANQAGDANHHAAPEVAHTFAVTAASANVTLTNLAQTYDGSVKGAGATTVPDGLPVSIIHNPASPTNAGDYGVEATVTDPRYVGSASGTLAIAKATQGITGFADPGDQLATASVPLSATGGASGEAVTFSVNAPGQIDGNTLTFTGPGTVTVRANQAGNGNYGAAPEVAHTFTVTAATTTLALSRLHQVADGTPRVIVVTTDPADLEIEVTYDGETDPPNAPGSYAVVASSTDARYEGSAMGTLVVDDPARSVVVPGGSLPALSALGELVVPTFQIGAYEVTGSQWATVVAWAEANAGYVFAGAGSAASGDRPVTGVSWSDAAKWCNARTEWENALLGRSVAPAYQLGGDVFKTGTPASPNDIVCDFGTSGHRLPTAAEWEFAARGGLGGAPSTFPGGNTLEGLGWFADNSEGAAQPAGGKAANGLGLYDLAGNAAEWTWDAPSTQAAQRLLRGGSWSSPAVECDLDALNGANPALPSDTTGFRFARSVSRALAEALDHAGLSWNSGGDELWFAQTGTTHDGEDAAESGPLSQSQTSWLETTVEGPGNLRFRWKTAGSEAIDVLSLSVDGAPTLNRSGTGEWEEQLVEIAGGSHTLRWTYVRGSDIGEARAWLDAVEFEGASEPSVTTTAASEVTVAGATLGGVVTSDGGREVIARGVVYATTTAPTLDSGTVLTADEGGIGAFTVTAIDLDEGTTYFARAYATNNLGTNYGEEIVFTTGASATFNNGVATFSRSLLPGGRQVFHFTVAGPRVVSLSTLGDGALRAELYGSGGNVIASFTGDANFDLKQLLLAGGYALHVFREADGGPVQTFDLTIDASTVAASRPDVAVGASPARMVGRNVYGGRQQASLVSTKARPVTGHVRVGNRGNLPDVLSVRGNPGNGFFTVTYFGPRNVTAAMRRGAHRTAALVNGAEASIRISVKPNKRKLTKKKGRRTTILRKSLTLTITASSTFNPAQRDAASLKVQTK